MGTEDGKQRRGLRHALVSLRPRGAELAAAAALMLMFGATYAMFLSTNDANAVIAVSPAQVLAQAARELGLPEAPSSEEYPEQRDDADSDDDVDPESPEEQAMEVQSAVEAARAAETPERALPLAEESTVLGKAARSTSRKRVAALGNLLFEDGAEYEAAPLIRGPETLLSGEEYAKLWYLQEMHDSFFQKQMHRRYIPRLAEPITRQQFHETFRLTSTPVVIPFEHMRKLGVLTRGWTLEQLRERFPYEPPPGAPPPNQYHSRAGLKNKKLDFGPALREIAQDSKLLRGAKGTGLRNYPRNMMLGSRYLAMFNISYPPFVPRKRFQVPTMWFGTSTSDTKLHSDCCDNWVSMLSGTKRWFIAPPTDARKLRPILCTGTHQSLCWASMKYPNEPQPSERDRRIKDALESVVLELKGGDMLYLPAGWWHHIENLGPTVMVNFWTRGCENVALALDKNPLRPDRPDFNACPHIAQDTGAFLAQA